jgi:adenine-specific DNA methylase
LSQLNFLFGIEARMASSIAGQKKQACAGIESNFDAAFATALALKEKQIQQNYRPIIGVHKWFARRPGTIFRSLLLSEFSKAGALKEDFWKAHSFRGVIADPFMGGGTPIFEANRLGFHVVGTDINPMAFWVVRQALAALDLQKFRQTAEEVVSEVESQVGDFYKTDCIKCHREANVKYFLWVKSAPCPACEKQTDLFPGYLLAEDERHPANVLACRSCGELNEFKEVPTRDAPEKCKSCRKNIFVEGNVSRKKAECSHCNHTFPILSETPDGPLVHRMWAIEYHCDACKSGHDGRFFKKPDMKDLARERAATALLSKSKKNLPIPSEKIPPGDESDRLHRWGYFHYRDMFGE